MFLFCVNVFAIVHIGRPGNQPKGEIWIISGTSMLNQKKMASIVSPAFIGSAFGGCTINPFAAARIDSMELS